MHICVCVNIWYMYGICVYVYVYVFALLVMYQEWDGLLRIAFSRKNKTLGGCFRSKVQFTEKYMDSEVICVCMRVEEV